MKTSPPTQLHHTQSGTPIRVDEKRAHLFSSIRVVWVQQPNKDQCLLAVGHDELPWSRHTILLLLPSWMWTT